MNKLHNFLITNPRKAGVLASLAVNLVYLNFVYAQGAAAVTNTRTLIDNVICPLFNAMFYILISISVVMVMWAAYRYVTAQDDSEKISKAHKTITYAAVAIVVALLAKGFPLLIAGIFPALNGSGIQGCP